GLVHACRYCGLLDASIAADRQAKRLEPGIRTSVSHTYFMNGEYARAIEGAVEGPPYVTFPFPVAKGDPDGATRPWGSVARIVADDTDLSLLLRSLGASIDGTPESGKAAVAELLNRRSFHDPEGWFYWALALVGYQDHDGALGLLARAVDAGLHCPRALESNATLDPLRDRPEYRTALARAIAGHDRAKA